MMTASPLPSPRIRLNTCNELFKKLEWEYDQLQMDWSEYHSFNFVITAYHLYEDWINKVATHDQRNRKKAFRNNTLGLQLFNVLRDITNATKHWDLDNPKSKAKQVVSEVSDPEIADWYAYFIAGEVVYVDVNMNGGKARPSMPEIADMTVKCLDWILNGTSQTIPQDIEDGLKAIFRPL